MEFTISHACKEHIKFYALNGRFNQGEGNIQHFMEDKVPLGLWTQLLHSLCKDYIDKVKGNLIQRALKTHINVWNILSPKTLDKTISRNKKLYIERKGHPPPQLFDDSSEDS